MIPPTVLESGRLVLRPVGPSDLAGMTALFSHPGATEAMALGPELKTPEGVARFVAAVDESHRSNGPVVLLAIRLKPSQEFVGACGLVKTPETSYAECVYAVSPPFQRRGFAPEAVELLIGHAFSNPELAQVIAHVLPDNTASVRVLEKIAPRTGMANLGLMDHPQYPRKVLRFSVTREAFEKKKAP